jgi:hypothetical protein
MTAQAHVAAIVLQATAYIPDADLRRVLLDVARYARNLEDELASRRLSSFTGSASAAASSLSPPLLFKKEEDDLSVNGILAERLDRFRLDSDRERYFGKSSHFNLINTAIDLTEKRAEENLGPKKSLPSVRRPQFWSSPVCI